MQFHYQKSELVFELQQALERKEFRLLYQPKLDLVTGKIVGMEALVRWDHPKKGWISPLDFIPLAEETGLILPIGEWVLKTACRQNKNWQDSGLPSFVMAVNLSASQLSEPYFVQKVQNIIKESGLAPKYLELEITESMMMDVPLVLPILQNLKNMGVQISLDDFGTGYSSLNYLKEFPIDTVKIDQSFVRNCTKDSKDATLVKAIIAMSHQLQLNVVAEGVETKDDLVFLQQQICNMGQGYFFSKPLPPQQIVEKFNEIEEMIEQEGIPKEVNKEKWLEKELEKARQELQDTVHQQQGMIFKFIKKGNRFIHTLCGGEILRRANLIPEQIVGKEVYDFLPYEDAVIKYNHYKRAWNGEERVLYEGEINGICYLASLRPIRKGGQVTEVIGSCVDITDRKKIEEQYKKLVTHSPEPIIVYQGESIQYANPACIRLLGASSLRDLKGHSILEFFDPESVQIIEKRIKEMNEIGTTFPPTEEMIVRKDGSKIHIEVTGITIHHEGKPAFLMIYHDISERKRQEEALKKSELKYRLIAENTEDLLQVVDIKGLIRYASPSHQKVVGLSPNKIENKRALQWIHPDDVPRIFKSYLNSFQNKKSFFVEFRYKHANGTWIHLEAQGTPVREPDGKIEKIVVVARDNSKRRRAEEAIRKADRLSVAGQLAAGVAHEIRNPLTTIKGFMQFLQKECDTPHMQLVLSEVYHLEKMVKEFLALSNSKISELRRINLNSLLQETVNSVQSQARIQNIEIKEIYGENLSIVCDKNQIKQALLNILQNSIEAMPEGGLITICLLSESSDVVRIRIIDQGVGITKERLKYIGEPYYSNKEKGIGLGLFLCEKIIREHKGKLNIESDIKKGTTVDILLPLNKVM